MVGLDVAAAAVGADVSATEKEGDEVERVEASAATKHFPVGESNVHDPAGVTLTHIDLRCAKVPLVKSQKTGTRSRHPSTTFLHLILLFFPFPVNVHALLAIHMQAKGETAVAPTVEDKHEALFLIAEHPKDASNTTFLSTNTRFPVVFITSTRPWAWFGFGNASSPPPRATRRPPTPPPPPPPGGATPSLTPMRMRILIIKSPSPIAVHFGDLIRIISFGVRMSLDGGAKNNL